MNWEQIYLLIMGGLILLVGVVQIVTGKTLTVHAKDYTEASRKKFARYSGVLFLLLGIVVCLLCTCVGHLQSLWILVLIGSGALIAIFYILFVESILKKKDFF